MLIPVTAALLAVPLASAADAASFRRCSAGSAFECGTVRAPLDYSGRTRGTVGLRVQRLISSRRHPRAVMFFAGGPGQAATPFADEVATSFAAAAQGYQIVVFDQRGSGGSGALNCPTLQRLGDVSGSAHRFGEGVAECGRLLGSRRAFYSTSATVEDTELVRRAIGAQRLTLYGVSYGTYVAERYALAYGKRVDRLVLDSVVPLSGVDDFQLSTFAAVPSVLRALCARRVCQGITGDPVADVAALVTRLRSRPVWGVLFSSTGGRRAAELSTSDAVLDVLVNGDLNAGLRAGFPAAIRSALAGDSAPILRLAALAHAQPPDPLGDQSDGLFVATTCTDTALPWAFSAPLAGRHGALAQAAAALSPLALQPFDTAAARRDSVGQACLRWPATDPVPRPRVGTYPKVPALLLSGLDDLRTPAADTASVAAIFGPVVSLEVAGTGHDVLGGDDTECASSALRNFLRRRRVRRCRRANRRPALVPIAPTTINALSPVGLPGRPGRTLRAARRSIDDALYAARTMSAQDVKPTLGGLRGGTLRAQTDRTDNPQRLVMRRYAYVPGVYVSGDLAVGSHVVGKLRIDGGAAARGWLKFHRDGTVTGRLGGRDVRRVRLG